MIPYEDIVIICRKDRKNLKPNIYINTEFLSIGESIQGNIIITCKENEQFKSLTKEQAIKYFNFLRNTSFNYKIINMNNSITFKTVDTIEKNKNEDILRMILDIQKAILKFIKNSTN